MNGEKTMGFTPKFKISVVNGVVEFFNIDIVKDYLRKNPDVCYVSFSKKVNSRSNQQNAYYWGCVVPIIADELGYTNEEMHKELSIKFLSEIYIATLPDGNKEITIIKSTSKLNTKEFEDYMTNVRQWASIHLNVYVPNPNEVEIET